MNQSLPSPYFACQFYATSALKNGLCNFGPFYGAREKAACPRRENQLWKVKREFQIGFLKTVGLRPEHLLLDIGCGTLRGGLPIIEYLQTRHYYGIEARPEVLAEGQKEVDEAGLSNKLPSLIVAERLSTVSLTTQFDFIWAFAVLIHMSDDRLDDTFAFVSKRLKTDGAFYANVNIGEKPQGEWQGFPVIFRPFSFYQTTATRHGLSIADLDSLGSLGHPPGDGGSEQRMLRLAKLA